MAKLNNTIIQGNLRVADKIYARELNANEILINGSNIGDTLLQDFVTINGEQKILGKKTFKNELVIEGNSPSAPNYDNEGTPKITFFDTNYFAQRISIGFTDENSYREPSGLKLSGPQGNEWFEAPQLYEGNQRVATQSWATTNFSLPLRLQSQSISGKTNPNEAIENGFYNILRGNEAFGNRPQFKQVDGSIDNDYRIITNSYGNTWLQQIATDYRSNDIFIRRNQSGTWMGWTPLVKMGQGSNPLPALNRSIPIWDTSRNATLQESSISINENNFIIFPKNSNNYSAQLGYTDNILWLKSQGQKIKISKTGADDTSYEFTFPNKNGTIATTNDLPDISTKVNKSGDKMTGTLSFSPNIDSLKFRDHNDSDASYGAGFFYGTDGNESLTITTKAKISALQFINGQDAHTMESGAWQTITPGLQIKNNKVAINKKLTSNQNPITELEVNGTLSLTNSSDSNTSSEYGGIKYDSTNKCIKFVFN